MRAHGLAERGYLLSSDARPRLPGRQAAVCGAHRRRRRAARQGPDQHARARREPLRGHGPRRRLGAGLPAPSSAATATWRDGEEGERAMNDRLDRWMATRRAGSRARPRGAASSPASRPSWSAARRCRCCRSPARTAAPARADPGRARADSAPPAIRRLRLLAPLRHRRLPLQLLRRHQRACPPGTEQSPVTWIGTCRNPADGKDYVISYNDCCGKHICGLCFCHHNQGDKPIYFPPRSNDINWCFGVTSVVYNCSTAIVLGVATREARGVVGHRGTPARCAGRGPLRAVAATPLPASRAPGRRGLSTTACTVAAATARTGRARPAARRTCAAASAASSLVPGGREYLMRVPGTSQSELDDAQTAALLNWMVREFSPAERGRRTSRRSPPRK